jgi:hypothetical protein
MAAAAATAADELKSRPLGVGVFLVEDIKGRQTDIGDFFLAEKKMLLARADILQRLGDGNLGRCAAR